MNKPQPIRRISPSVAAELAEAAGYDFDRVQRTSIGRATVVSGFPGGIRFTFEDRSCIELLLDEIIVHTNCQEK